MKTVFLRFFTWWNGVRRSAPSCCGPRCYGELVGEDEFGNRYYRTKGGKIDPALGFERRWVIYNGVRGSLDACRRRGTAGCITPSTCRRRRTKVTPRPWWKPHRPNLTGTPGAAPSRPALTLAQGRRAESDRRLQGLDPGPLTRCGRFSGPDDGSHCGC